MSETTRRAVLAGAAGATAAAALAACGTSTGGSDTGSGSGATTGAAGGATTGVGGAALAKKSDIPVGGGKIFNQAIVVTQPTAGDFKAFSAICTHQGCPVNEVKNGTIN